VLSELQRGAEFGSEGLYVFDLAFCDGVEDVTCPLLNEGDEGPVAEGAVRPTEGESVGEVWDSDAKV